MGAVEILFIIITSFNKLCSFSFYGLDDVWTKYMEKRNLVKLICPRLFVSVEVTDVIQLVFFPLTYVK